MPWNQGRLPLASLPKAKFNVLPDKHHDSPDSGIVRVAGTAALSGAPLPENQPTIFFFGGGQQITLPTLTEVLRSSYPLPLNRLRSLIIQVIADLSGPVQAPDITR